MKNFNDLRGLIWRKWDLNIHSNASDGKMGCNEIIEESIKREL